MPVKLNHTIVHCRDQRAWASFLSEVLGLPAPTSFGPFPAVQVADDVSLDFLEEGRSRAQQVNTSDGGRGLYWLDPDGHVLEILPVPYGGWPEPARP